MYLLAESVLRSSRRCVSQEILFLLLKPKVNFRINGMWRLMASWASLIHYSIFPNFLLYTARCSKQPVPFSIVCYLLPMRSTHLIIISFSPSSCSFLPLRSQYSTQYLAVRHTQYTVYLLLGQERETWYKL